MAEGPDSRRRLLLDRAAIATAAAAASLASRPHLGLATTPRAEDRPFWFGFIGDTPYSRREEGALRLILEALAPEPLKFVLHVGDLKSRLESCDDALLASRLQLLNQCPHPIILTPGDNEWTDCDPSLPAWHPEGRLGRLEWLRAHAYRLPESLGRRRMPLEQQAAYRPEDGRAPAGSKRVLASPRLPENLRWRVGSLQFCTLHVVGSNNADSEEADLAEAWQRRQQANTDWLDETVQLALRDRAAGLVIALHANMRFEGNRSDGWERMRSRVIAAAIAFDGPVLLLHGDTHHFRSDRLLRRSHGLANLQRVECFGSPFSASWVQIRWDPSLALRGAGVASDAFQVSTRSLS
jgi:hypothetical protein